MSRQLLDLALAETSTVPAELDLRDPQHLASVTRVADRFLETDTAGAGLAQL